MRNQRLPISKHFSLDDRHEIGVCARKALPAKCRPLLDKLEKIADVIVKIGPFLKLYSWYIHDFESNVALLEESKKKYPPFAQVVKEFEASSRCKRLALNHFMLKPIQRIPQYRLLLQEYLHQLSEDSPDYQDTVTALQIVSEVAGHANDSMKQG
ncbi:FYVE, RhoGEF and PH domain-containing protein 6, partial [Araneus ventricosus]